MAIDPTTVLCDYDDARPAVAFVRESFILGRWEPCCREHRDHFEASPHAKYQIVDLDDPTGQRRPQPDHDPDLGPGVYDYLHDPAP